MKKMKLYGLAGVAALAAVGGTFAYYSAAQTFNNPFDTTKYSTSSTEKFNPNGDNKEWKPGVEVDKKVYATNTGEGDVWVRIKFGEKWTDKAGNLLGLPVTDGYHFTSKDGLVKFGVRENDDFTDSSAYQHQGSEGNYDTDGIIKDDTGSVVGKTLADNYEANWYYNATDGYFYYTKVLEKTQTTETLLESVTLYEDTDMGHFEDVEYYIAFDAEPATLPQFNAAEWKLENKGKDYDGWTWGIPSKDDASLKDKHVYTYKANLLDKEKSGYGNANYELDITVDFLQTTEDGEMVDTANWDQAALKKIGLLPADTQ